MIGHPVLVASELRTRTATAGAQPGAATKCKTWWLDSLLAYLQSGVSLLLWPTESVWPVNADRIAMKAGTVQCVRRIDRGGRACVKVGRCGRLRMLRGCSDCVQHRKRSPDCGSSAAERVSIVTTGLMASLVKWVWVHVRVFLICENWSLVNWWGDAAVETLQSKYATDDEPRGEVVGEQEK